MVFTGDLSPDPSNRSSDESYIQADVGMIIAPGSETEEEGSYDGYEALSQDLGDVPHVLIFDNEDGPETDDDDDDDDSDCNYDDDGSTCINFIVNKIKELPSFDQSTKLEAAELWNTTNSNRQSDIVIDSTKEEEIKNAMAGFQLPLSAIPPWAAKIPEEEWKEQLKIRVALLNNVQAV